MRILLAGLFIATLLSIRFAEADFAGVPITYSLKSDGFVSLIVADEKGKVWRTFLSAEPRKAGTDTESWDGLDRYGNPGSVGSYTWKLLQTQRLKSELVDRLWRQDDGDNEWEIYTLAQKDKVNALVVDAQSGWPDARWYAAEQKLPDGTQFGAAIINSPGNPPALWHNHRDVRMLNPCICAPGEVKLPAGKPLVLRYRVVTFDGALPAEKVNALAGEWK